MKPQVISASRRTDIPAFYAEWLMNRIRAGHCRVPNPVNPTQVSDVSLAPQDVAALVFWTRDAGPLLPHLDELERRGYRYLFLYTLLGYPRRIDPACPASDRAVRTFRDLSERVGPERVIWRYDPMLLSSVTDPAYHVATFERLAAALTGNTRRCVISFLDRYRKTVVRLDALAADGIRLVEPDRAALDAVVPPLVRAAREAGMTIQSCAETRDLSPYGVAPGACIDPDYLSAQLGVSVSVGKDRSQRGACRCVAARDIGMYDTCGFGCAYCYATGSAERVAAQRRRHDPTCASLVPPADGGRGG